MGLTDDWRAFQLRGFPAGVAGTEIDGVCVTTVDTFAAGCLETYFDRGRLDQQRIGVLEECVGDLHRVLPHLTGEPSEYFGKLAALCRGVLGAIGRRN
jgi:hypothetical protein